MNIRFIKLNPTQNMTILAETPVPREMQSCVADALMDYSNVYAEQVGFLEQASDPAARVRLQMMGGEFCGNASMSCAAYLAYCDQLPDGQSAAYPLEVSGCSSIIVCSISRIGNAYLGTVSMPIPESIREVRFSNGLTCPVVFFHGIAHAILPDSSYDDSVSISDMCNELGCDALGILRTDSSFESIRPIVYVKSTRTSVHERGCGSGSAALIAYLAHCAKTDFEADIRQPGGIIHAAAVYSGNAVTSIQIIGTVRISAIGTAFIDI